MRKVGVDGTVKIKEQLLPNTPPKEKKKKKTDSGLFFPLLHLDSFMHFKGCFFLFLFLCLEPFQLSCIKNHFKRALHYPITFFNFIIQKLRQKGSDVGSQKCRPMLLMKYWLRLFRAPLAPSFGCLLSGDPQRSDSNLCDEDTGQKSW